jgi:hypothetical protein
MLGLGLALFNAGACLAGPPQDSPEAAATIQAQGDPSALIFSDGFEDDLCPDEPRKTEPGACGCNMPETPDCLVYGGKAPDPITSWNVAIILVDFSDTAPSVRDQFPDAAEIEETFFSSNSLASEFLTDMSHGHLTTLTGDVFGPFTHPRTLEDLINSGDYHNERYSHDFLLDTKSAIQIPGFVAEDYNMIYFISYDDYSWNPGGLTDQWTFRINDQDVQYLGTVQALQIGWYHRDPQQAFVNIFTEEHSGTVFSPDTGEVHLPHSGHAMTRFERTFLHEIVHAMGVHSHANSSLGDGFPLTQPPEHKSSPHEAEDYGDYFGLMGRSEFSVSIVAAYRHLLGWYDDSVKATLASIGKHKVTLYPSNAASGIRAVEIRLPYRVDRFHLPPENRQNDGYFLEIRDPAFKWDSALVHPEIIENTKGVLVTFNDGFTSWLLDMSPSPYLVFSWGSTPDRRDMVLKPGMTFESPDVRISCTGVTGNGGYKLEIDILGTW